MKRACVFTTFVVLFCGSASAQTVGGQIDLERRLQVLEEQVKTIQAEITALKTSLPASQAPVQPIAPGAPAGAGGGPDGRRPADGDTTSRVRGTDGVEALEPGRGHHRQLH
jgi:hypothetical protein